MARVRRTATRTGVGVVATGLLAVSVLAVEAELARRGEYVSADSAPRVSGLFGDAAAGAAGAAPLRLAVLGDSTAAGLGVTDAPDTVGAQVATRLSQALRRPVQLDGLGVSGAQSADLQPQVARALLRPPDVAIILIGPNDVTHLTSSGSVEEDVAAAVRRLRSAGVAVVVGSCADMGSATAFHQPLRVVAAWRGRAIGQAARAAATDSGADVVDIGAETGPAFRREPERYLSADRFHPSAEGYRLWAEALLPAVRRAAGVPAST